VGVFIQNFALFNPLGGVVFEVVCEGVFEVRILADVDDERVVKVLPFQKLFELLSHKIEFFSIFVRILFHEVQSTV
jgi:hypothetical protein